MTFLQISTMTSAYGSISDPQIVGQEAIVTSVIFPNHALIILFYTVDECIDCEIVLLIPLLLG